MHSCRPLYTILQGYTVSPRNGTMLCISPVTRWSIKLPRRREDCGGVGHSPQLDRDRNTESSEARHDAAEAGTYVAMRYSTRLQMTVSRYIIAGTRRCEGEHLSQTGAVTDSCRSVLESQQAVHDGTRGRPRHRVLLARSTSKTWISSLNMRSHTQAVLPLS